MLPELLLLSGCLLQAPDPLVEAGRALRENRPEEALTLYQARLQTVPGDADALVGAGFAALRAGRLAESQAHFRTALALAPRYADAAYGLALCADRQGQPVEALSRIRQALALEPKRADFLELSARLDPPPPAPPPPYHRPATVQVPFKVDLKGFQVPDGQGGWRPLFLKGVNLGAALPGKFPSEFPDKPVYAAWLRDMAELGVNALRAYTIHPPAFYEALREHNLAAPHPIYLIHGVWTEPPPEDDFSNPVWFAGWKEEMSRVVDLLHGRADIPARPGHASGSYRADVSPWWIATLLGREWEPNGIWAYHQKRPGTADWRGAYVRVKEGNATEIFMAQAMDAFLALEMDRYHAQRPMAFTNWPTLDPLHHPTESTHAEEVVLRKKMGLPVAETGVDMHWDEDAIGLDMEKVFATDAFSSGFFASYHAYPYYPDFLNLDPAYRRVRDEEGPNSYFGYLKDLVRHHRRTPVVIAEFGVPSSRLVAHAQPQGLHHGSQNERLQGEHDARLFRNIRSSGCAGGLLFAWIDEWFKKNWLNQRFELPPERKPLWFNPMDAEENYGLIGYHPGTNGPHILIDGQAGDWAQVPIYLEGRTMTLKLLADEGWLHLGLSWQGPDPSSDGGILVGLDTYGKDLGARQLPFGLPFRSQAGLEFALKWDSEGCGIWVDGPYDPSLHRHPRPYATLDHEGGPWVLAQTESNRERVGRDGTHYPPIRQDIGMLRRGTARRGDPAFDSLAEWQKGATPGGGFLEVRIPWGLLNVTDPSMRRVIQDGRPLQEQLGTAITDGFRALVVRYRQDPPPQKTALEGLPAIDGTAIPAPPLFTWATWDQPHWHAFRKQSFEVLKAALAALPNTPFPRTTP